MKPLAVSALVLAAGAASRLGHRPKSLLQLKGVPLIRRQLEALASCEQPLVVLGHYAELIAPVVESCGARWVLNPKPEAGQISSLRLGLGALSGEAEAVLVALADQPLITAKDIDELIEAYRQRPHGMEVVQPEVKGQPANPVMFSSKVRAEILAARSDVGCRQWQSAHPEQVHHWPSANAHYSTDIDSEQDIKHLRQHFGVALDWPTSDE